ncbi:MAG: helix-turn-helix transcriptional regulator [Rickettsiales bacterium]|jgi:DNA-binding XRE family transcriptional regulator|nr:helix-turn-helix transcriptional regulator [Rickettsiales bacterium]
MKNKYISDYTLDNLIEKECENIEFKKLYEKQILKNKLSKMLIEARKEKGMTQTELAKKINTKQASIARLERNNVGTLPSLEFLYNVANALGKEIKISF